MSTSTTPTAAPRELVLASAGSGKTYHLSSRIILLLAAGAPVDEVLASTFTRKAAGEILERVLVRIAESALDPDQARELGRDAHPSLAEPEACRHLLARLVSDLHQLNVGTLDAFFIRVARSFFQELGLAPGWTIADLPTHERLRTEAVQAALAGADTMELTQLLRMLNQGSADRRIHDALVDQVDDLVSVRRQLDPEAIAPWSPDLGVTGAPTPEELEAEAATLAEHLGSLEVPTTQAGAPMKLWVSARDTAAGAIARRDWVATFDKGIGAKLLEGADSYSRKPISAEFIDTFNEARKLARIDLAPKLRRQAEAMGRLAELLETELVRAQRRAGAYRFEDITYLLGGPDPAGARDDLQYRLDQQVRHLLLDEFQDTSLEQWRALAPLADELLSGHLGERAGVIVADTKQSIYGWRGARPELVHQVGETYALTGATLGTSWRSSPVVLEFVADIFRGLTASPVMASIDVGPRVAAAWMEDFTELEAARPLPGHVCIHPAPPDSGSSAIRPSLLRRAAEVVAHLHQQMPDRTIGVLVRRNAVLAHLMNELRNLGIRASGEGGTSLTDMPPVNALLSLLRLADHPSDRSARYHVARSPLGEVVGFSDWTDQEAARGLASRVRRQLLSDGYGPTLATWVHDLAPRCDAREVLRLLQLVELGHRWDDRPTLRPTDFTRYVASESVEDPSSAPVKVMTVHRSKGLEFDVVVLPELYASLAPKGGGVVIPVRGPDGRVVEVYPGVSGSIRAFFPEIEAAEGEVRAAQLRDALSVLYVALTRAKYALHLIVPPAAEPGKSTPKHSAQLIRAALGMEGDAANDGGLLLERGDPAWSDRLQGEVESVAEAPTGEPSSAPTAAAGPLLRRATADPGRNLPRRSPSSLEGGSRVDLAFALRLDVSFARQRGSIVHAWCEEIEWLEDGIPDDATLRTIARRVTTEWAGEQVADLIEDFRIWMKTESMRTALSRDAYPSAPGIVVRVENELPFVRRVGGEIQEGFIDRLVLIERDGQVVGAEILDFKTDAIEPGDEAGLTARTEHYRPQAEAYCDVVREQHRLAADGVRARLVFLGAGVVKEVRPQPVTISRGQRPR